MAKSFNQLDFGHGISPFVLLFRYWSIRSLQQADFLLNFFQLRAEMGKDSGHIHMPPFR